MKIRQGFVSNSSSSSFCMYGVYFDYESDISEALIEKGLATKEELSDGVYDFFDDWSFKYNLKKKGLSEEEIKAKMTERPCEGFAYESIVGECHFIGINWNHIQDDETGAEFKARIEKGIKEIFGDEVSCSTHIETWRDG